MYYVTNIQYWWVFIYYSYLQNIVPVILECSTHHSFEERCNRPAGPPARRTNLHKYWSTYAALLAFRFLNDHYCDARTPQAHLTTCQIHLCKPNLERSSNHHRLLAAMTSRSPFTHDQRPISGVKPPTPMLTMRLPAWYLLPSSLHKFHSARVTVKVVQWLNPPSISKRMSNSWR